MCLVESCSGSDHTDSASARDTYVEVVPRAAPPCRGQQAGTLRSLGAVVDAGQILNVTVQLFYTREESADCDTLGFLHVTTNVDLLTFCGVFIEDGLQMEHGTR